MLVEIQQITINRLKFFILSSRHVTVLDCCFKLFTFLKIIPELFKLHIFYPTFVTTSNISLSYHIIGLKSNTEIILYYCYTIIYTHGILFCFFFPLSYLQSELRRKNVQNVISSCIIFFFVNYRYFYKLNESLFCYLLYCEKKLISFACRIRFVEKAASLRIV